MIAAVMRVDKGCELFLIIWECICLWRRIEESIH